MILPLFVLIGIVAAYFLFIRGWLFKLLIAAGFLLIAPAWLIHSYPGSAGIIITIGNLGISWAWAIPLGVLLLAMLTTRSE